MGLKMGKAFKSSTRKGVLGREQQGQSTEAGGKVPSVGSAGRPHPPRVDTPS